MGAKKTLNAKDKSDSDYIADLMEQYANANPKAASYKLGLNLPPCNGVEIDIHGDPITFSENLGHDFLIMVNNETIYMAGEEMHLGFDIKTGQEGFGSKRYYKENTPNLESVTSWSRFGGLTVI